MIHGMRAARTAHPPPREPFFQDDVPVWIILVLTLSVGFALGVLFILIAARLAP